VSVADSIIWDLIPCSVMTEQKNRKKRHQKPVIDLLPELLVQTLARGEDFIVTFENDPENPPRKLHVMTGKFISGCMLRKLQGQAESQHDEGSTLLTRDWH
jgi:hypothetical protein